MALTAAQQNQLNTLQVAYNAQLAVYNVSVNVYGEAKRKADECQNLRDQHNTGWAKNNACHIDTLSSLNQQRDSAQERMRQDQMLLNERAAAITKFQDEVDRETQQQVDTLLADPAFNLQMQANQLAVGTAERAAKLKLAEDEAKRKFRNTIIIASVVVVALLVTAFIVIKKKKKSE